MTAGQIKLFARNNLPIVGIRLEDGSLCDFEYTYDGVNQGRYFKLLNRTGDLKLEQNAEMILVDSAGNEWPATDVEFDSILKS